MLHKKIKAILAGVGLSLIMTTGVWASVENTEELYLDEVQSEIVEEQSENLETPEEPSEEPPAMDVSDPEENDDTEETTDPPEEDPDQGSTPVQGWQSEEDGCKYYDQDGNFVTGFQEIGARTYCFDEKGNLRLGYYTDDEGRTWYFKKTGTLGDTLGCMLKGWNRIGGKTYYFEKTGELGISKGVMAVGWKVIGGKTFYFDEADTVGAMAHGWKTIGAYDYYFKATGDSGVRGQMFTGWKTIGGKIFYFQKNGEPGRSGRMYTGWYRIEDKTYYFEKNGEYGVKGYLYTGWNTIDGKVFYFNKLGNYGNKGMRRIGWLTLDGKKYHMKTSGGFGVTGSMDLGWTTVGNNTYYFKKSGDYGVRGEMFKGWKTISGNKHYFGTNGALKTGWLSYSGQWYYMDPKNNGAMATGWFDVPAPAYNAKTCYRDTKIKSYRFYFRPNSSGGPVGSLVEDVSGIIGKQSEYRAEVDRVKCVVTIYAKDESGLFRIPVKAMTCSVGLPSTPTPQSVYKDPFKTIEKMRWGELMGPSYGQYCTRIVAGILFHSVAGSNMTPYNLSAANYNMLGQPASHGCVRLCVRDAKWIYDNCPLGMQVVIQDNMYQPFSKPATIKIPAGQTWDPTDPAV